MPLTKVFGVAQNQLLNLFGYKIMEKKLSFHIVGLDCAEEIKILRKAVESRDGVKDLAFDVLSAKMTVTFDPGHVTAQHVIDWVKGEGMQASVWEVRRKDEPTSFWAKYGRLIMATFSGLFLLLGFSLHIFFHPNVLDILGEVDDATHRLPILVILFLPSFNGFRSFLFCSKSSPCD